MKYTILFIISYILLSCSSEEDKLLEYALDFAGKNRLELQNVLNHYKRDKKDSLKYKAARFLIENMPHYYTSYGYDPDFFKLAYTTAIEQKLSGETVLKILEDKYGKINPGNLTKKYDAHVITAQFLIDNIDFSFEVWKKQKWKESVSFDDFCNYILPYRVGDEPLENWKKIYYEKYSPILDSLPDNVTLKEICDTLYKEITRDKWVFVMNTTYPHQSATSLLNNRFGSCRDRCDLGIYIMRSLGIPVGIDFVLQNPCQKDRHFWNFMLDENKKTIPFTLWDEHPEFSSLIDTDVRKRGKVYRQTFGVQKTSLPFMVDEKENIPGLLSNFFIKDISDYYFNNNIEFDSDSCSDEIVYLAVFNNEEWVPMAWEKIKDKKATFRGIEKEVVFLPCFYRNNKVFPKSYPFTITDKGLKKEFIPDKGKKQVLTLTRKYPSKLLEKAMIRFLGGKFQTDNKADFSNPTTLYVITELPEMIYYTLLVNTEKQFRYIRYIGQEKSHCNMAELAFYDENNIRLNGEIIGTTGSFEDREDRKKEVVFDGNPLTFFGAPGPGKAWVGLDFGTKKRISKIMYLPRNDDNGIRKGDEYELFYADSTGWISLGKQVGTESQMLLFENAPLNALFWLRNHTRGQEERIFTYENGKQIFW